MNKAEEAIMEADKAEGESDITEVEKAGEESDITKTGKAGGNQTSRRWMKQKNGLMKMS